MREPFGQNSAGPGPASEIEPASHSDRQSQRSHRLRGYIASLTLLAVVSTFAGFQAARCNGAFARWLNAKPVCAASSLVPPPALVSSPNSAAENADIDQIARLAPQQQAERLLDLAIHRNEVSLDMIRQNLDSWRGHLEDTDQLFHLVLAALESNDPRVRVAAVEIDLAANNLRKSPQSLAKLLDEIHHNPQSRYMALWRLGSLGNRGVDPVTVLATLLRYAQDRDERTRFWAVEGLAMLGAEESIAPLLSILAHDRSSQVRERAACDLARSGMFTSEQRLAAVPQLLNLLDDDSLDAATQNLVYGTLRAITGASLGKNPDAWREWWAHHDRREKPSSRRSGLSLA